MNYIALLVGDLTIYKSKIKKNHIQTLKNVKSCFF